MPAVGSGGFPAGRGVGGAPVRGADVARAAWGADGVWGADRTADACLIREAALGFRPPGAAFAFRNANASGRFVETKPRLDGKAVSDGATTSTPVIVSSRFSTRTARACVGRSK